MKYLLRAARRLESAGASPLARPALPLRSPLAEADQRLNIDSFASRFDAPFIPERFAPAPPEEPFAAPPSERRAGTSAAPGESRPTPPADAPAAVPPAAAARRKPLGGTARTPARAKDVSESQNTTALPSATRDARPRRKSSGDDAETSPAPVTPDRPARRANGLPGPSKAEDHGHERAGVERVQAAKGGQPTGGTMLDALSRAMSWVEGDARRSAEAERAAEQATPPAPRARFDERTRSRSGEAKERRERPPVTHLEIGKIEVEIAPPSRPAQNTAPPRRETRAGGAGAARRQPFGWRQR